jgi:uncharacterized membrane protein
MGSFVSWVHDSGISGWITGWRWLWPICEAIHFFGLALLVGVTGLLDLRLLGAMRSVPAAAIIDFMPWAVLGFALNFATGVIFFLGAPEQYVNNVAFYAKMLFILLAGVNAIYFQIMLFKKTRLIGAGEQAPVQARIVAVVSMGCWLLVMYWGRMLPFVGGAF